MKRLILLSLSVICLSLQLSAQKDQTLFGSRGLGLSGAWGASTTSLTFFDDDFAIVTGGYGGLEFGKDVFLGWGGFSTTNDFEIDRFDNERLALKYNGFIVGYAPSSYKVFHPEFMLLAGGGQLRLVGEDTDKIFVLQPMAGVEINILRWFRLGLDAGYRFVTDTDLFEIKDSEVSAPFAEVTFKFGWSWGR